MSDKSHSETLAETSASFLNDESAAPLATSRPQNAVLAILFALSFSHLINDTLQSVIPAIYPLLQQSFSLTFTQIGLITLTNQLTASLLQPLVGFYTDRYPKPFSLAIGMGFTLTGLLLLSFASAFGMVLISVAFVGIGSSVFHPEASRVARLASGGRHGFAQSLFQVGGNAGTSFGPLLAAWIILPRGHASLIWFTLVALTGIIVLAYVGRWYRGNLRAPKAAAKTVAKRGSFARKHVIGALAILVVLVFSKYFYLTSMTSYYTFYLIQTFGVTKETSEYFLFIFLFAVAAGTIIGGPHRRSLWPQARDLGVDSRRDAVHAVAALREPVAGGDPHCLHRRDSRVGVLGHRCLRAGTRAGQRRHDRGTFLRPRVRHGAASARRCSASWPT